MNILTCKCGKKYTKASSTQKKCLDCAKGKSYTYLTDETALPADVAAAMAKPSYQCDDDGAAVLAMAKKIREEAERRKMPRFKDTGGRVPADTQVMHVAIGSRGMWVEPK